MTVCLFLIRGQLQRFLVQLFKSLWGKVDLLDVFKQHFLINSINLK